MCFFFLFSSFSLLVNSSGADDNCNDAFEYHSPAEAGSFDLPYTNGNDEPYSPLSAEFDDLNLLDTEDDGMLPSIESLTRYIFSIMTEEEINFVIEFGRMLEDNFNDL